MSLAAKMHGSWLVGCAALFLVVACGDEDDVKPGNKDAGAQEEKDAGGGKEPDAGDEQEVPPTRDAGEQEPEDAGADLDATDSDGGDTDGDVPVDGDAAVALPADGELLSICYTDDDCTGDGLKCYVGAGANPGFCAGECATNDDCEPVDGIDTTCSPDGVCRIECAGDMAMGDGPCPTRMECRDASTLPPPFGESAWRCAYPAGGGSKAGKEYEKCVTARAGADCSGDLVCHVPGGSIVPQGPGYCSAGCTTADECEVPQGVTSVAVCSVGGQCELDCEGPGAMCPSGMNCRENTITTGYRCRFIDAP